MTHKNYKGDQSSKKEKLLSRNTKEKYENGKLSKVEDQKCFMGRQIEPPFVKLYLDDIEILYRLPKSSSAVLNELLGVMNYQGEISINTVMKKRICEKLSIKNTGSINNYLTKMVQKDILKRIGRGVYIANPYLFAKGDWSKSIKGLRVEYKNGDREISSIEEKEEVDFKEIDIKEVNIDNFPHAHQRH